MKINEVSDKFEKKINFDLTDDVKVFMQNDPNFYRKHYFPALDRVIKIYAKNKSCNVNKHLEPVVNKGMIEYCKKYDIARKPEDLFTKKDFNSILKSICDDERENLRSGKYNED